MKANLWRLDWFSLSLLTCSVQLRNLVFCLAIVCAVESCLLVGCFFIPDRTRWTILVSLCSKSVSSFGSMWQVHTHAPQASQSAPQLILVQHFSDVACLFKLLLCMTENLQLLKCSIAR